MTSPVLQQIEVFCPITRLLCMKSTKTNKLKIDFNTALWRAKSQK